MNAPPTFQCLMNKVFQPYFQLFILVFFDEILIFNQSWTDRIHHLRLTLDLFQARYLFVKMSKYQFRMKECSNWGILCSVRELPPTLTKFKMW